MVTVCLAVECASRVLPMRKILSRGCKRGLCTFVPLSPAHRGGDGKQRRRLTASPFTNSLRRKAVDAAPPFSSNLAHSLSFGAAGEEGWRDRCQTGVHLCIGVFDGCHLGHQLLFETVRRQAASDAGATLCLTFDPHPDSVIRAMKVEKEKEKSGGQTHNEIADKTQGTDYSAELIWPLERRIRTLTDRENFDAVSVDTFDQDYAKQTPEDFLQRIFLRFPSLKSVTVGEDFVFGARAQGNVEILQEICSRRGIDVLCVGDLKWNGSRVSSSTIRRRLREGQVGDAAKLLGIPSFSLSGKFVSGKRLGRTIGFPTLNIRWTPQCSPRFGVYAVELKPWHVGGEGLPGVANFGLRPTVNDADPEPLLEVHLLEPQGEAGEGQADGQQSSRSSTLPYLSAEEGHGAAVALLDFLRPEKKFNSLDELKEQLKTDCQRAKEVHEARRSAGFLPAFKSQFK
uniref:Riboflavin kinase domain-containing protein n=1 Tax=Chromera velia CCMP2878 TaxID=1169474 RepID=A0A0G4GAS8_9ALVE|eukprot:Cvel_21053.t1-p1 / transcript=Cvel_21053.t1 / gene=Cvel_21053 / organism=Chromera_velia_CCMP2878 / gene_product=Riboflavin biosynthesis protein RibF, putative / transcript_product=Riboflavin biosynthesis protein RibF, putative / location=Cvel_scaffold1944:14034-19858(+) / protein_length=455 / sequence_SO=supercontig / SO=protein_coding / is_pseudo=false